MKAPEADMFVPQPQAQALKMEGHTLTLKEPPSDIGDNASHAGRGV